ncbi:chromosome segregation protein SMC, partial [Candidatus Sumerlaeota bacterium]|nr:chromosome segregation protein SMC [Candidatus Sumerlaeota bacterium]
QIQRDERMVENDLHERQLRQAELQGNLNNLAEQAREKFNNDLFAIIAELGPIQKDVSALSQDVIQLREKLDRMGAVNLAALDEYNEQNTRLQFLTTQQADLVQSKAQIEASIAQLDETTKQLFHETFESVRGHFIEMFRRLFDGGKADLVIDQQSGDPLLEGGIEIYAQPPGKKLQTLSLMSGGEKAMTAISLLFAIFLHKPAPFAILDEIDAPLDDANVERFKNVVMEFSNNTQFVIISHNKQTMELADAIYGVTMEESGVSKLVSVRFQQAAEQFSTNAG